MSDLNRTPEPVLSGCVACNRPHTEDNFVCCDKCDRWWHFSCAGVTASVEMRDWICSKCLPVPHTTPGSVTSSLKSVSSSHRLRTEQHLTYLAEQQELERLQMLKEFELQKKHLEQKHQLLAVQDEGDNQSVRSRRSIVSHSARSTRTMNWVQQHNNASKENVAAGAPLEGAVGGTVSAVQATAPAGNDTQQRPQHVTPGESVLVRELERREEESQRQIQMLRDQLNQLQLEIQQQKKGNQVTNAATSKGAVSKTRPNIPAIAAPAHRQPGYIDWQISPVETGQPAPIMTFEQPRKHARSFQNADTVPDIPTFEQQRNVARMNQMNREVGQTVRQREQSSCIPQASSVERNPVIERQRPQPTLTIAHSGPSSSEPPADMAVAAANIGPTQEQLAARQVLPRDLPMFSGDPADWPVFISHYNYTTQACGYSNGENMIRLQRCLKGAAWESVKSRLILPASTPQVIESLRMRFGRPDLLIESFIEKVKAASTPRADRLDTLIEFGTSVQGLCDHIVAANLLEHLENPTLLKDLVGKLPAEYKMKWASYRKQAINVNLKTFSVFMEEIVEDAYSVSTFASNDRQTKRDGSRHNNGSFVHADIGDDVQEHNEESRPKHVSAGVECSVCHRYGHRAKECKLFLEMTVDERWKKIQNQDLCRTCLFSHGRRACRNSNRCGIDGCQYRHHPLLHPTAIKHPPSNRHQTDHMHHHNQSKLLFRIIPVTLYGQQGIINTFAFLDEGSSLSMIESSLADRLGVDGYSRPLCLKWTGNVTREENDSKRVAFEISGLGKTERYWISDVGTTKSLNLPMQTLPVKKLMQDFQHLRGIPIEEYHDAVPRLLIGVDNLKLSLPLKVREGKEGVPVAVKTRLGWCVYGGQRSDDSSLASYHICECNEDTGMDETVKAYFSMEDVGVRPANDCMSEEDKRAHQILEETTIFVGDRYESGLLWRFDKFELPDSYPMAIKRLQCLQRRMEKDPVLKENIQRQIQEYLERGYAHRASAEELSTADPRRIWFLPLGAVVNPKKPSKVRLIWDASAKVDGISLNDMLLKGPDQLASLPGVIFRFRQHRVAVVGDIKQMFHQIFIKNSDRYAQCFLWSPEAQKKPDVFVMNVATFGSTSSPATAQFVKNVNAQRFSEEFPRAVEGIVYNHYVDDYLDSFPDEDEAKRVAGEVRDVHRKGGFEIRNWCSNSSAVLKHLGENQDKVVKTLNPDSGGLPDRVLGMLWNSEEDVIHFVTAMRENIKKIIQEDARPTKRQVLQCVMTLFDPVGLLAPYLIFGRVLIQDIWRAGTKWDEQVDDSIFQRWRDWVKILQDIDEVRIPRCYFRCANRLSLDRIQLHIFVDASPAAYSCACYFRIINAQGKAEVALVAAKAKVAPLKMMSVPRLELQACVLGVRMMKLVIDGHTFPIKARFL
ncbi:uncharacterized protein LOC115254319 [Aedes albopictus]|uniref:PHD-type domain-containing protein n=1 Tax=Aedes albopictus TaxID=7160 RepID=A0ABM1YM91_AEDAL